MKDVLNMVYMNLTNKIIIAGGRNFNNYDLLKETCSKYIRDIDSSTIEIVSGGANGADALGERFASEYKFPVKLFQADWNKYGRAAGPKRNANMASYGTHLIAFWDGKSRGTKNMINQAKKSGLQTKVVLI